MLTLDNELVTGLQPQALANGVSVEQHALQVLRNETKLNAPKPDILFHYTNIESFKKIIESGVIRATRYDQLNDHGEVQLGVNLLRDAVSRHEVKNALKDFKEFLLSEIADFLYAKLDIFVLSLSGAADSLDQWRAYARDGGFAIGFSFQSVQNGFLHDVTRLAGGGFVENARRPDPGNQLMPCIYTDAERQLDLRPEVERLLAENPYGACFEKPNLWRAVLPSLATKIYRIICRVKHGAYASEMEWRSVRVRTKSDHVEYPVKLSESNRSFIEMEFDIKPFIKEVWISPNGDVAACERAVTYLIERSGLDFAVKKSRIPFRE